MWVMWNLVSARLEAVLVLVQDRCTVCQTYQRLINPFGRSQWKFKVTRLMGKLDSVYLETVLILTQDKCTVWPNGP